MQLRRLGAKGCHIALRHKIKFYLENRGAQNTEHDYHCLQDTFGKIIVGSIGRLVEDYSSQDNS